MLLDCHGVGYEVNVPMSTFYNLPAVGERVSLLTQFIVREGAAGCEAQRQRKRRRRSRRCHAGVG